MTKKCVVSKGAINDYLYWEVGEVLTFVGRDEAC